MSLLLTGCFGIGDEDTTQKENGNFYKTNEFEISVPESWDTIEPGDFTSEVPADTKIVLRNKIKNEIFIANINVVKNFLPEGVSEKDYIKKFAQSHAALLQNFQKFEEKETDQGAIFSFEGKRTASDPIIKFTQKIAIKEGKIFIATAAYINNEDEKIKKEADEIVQSLKAL